MVEERDSLITDRSGFRGATAISIGASPPFPKPRDHRVGRRSCARGTPLWLKGRGSLRAGVAPLGAGEHGGRESRARSLHRAQARSGSAHTALKAAGESFPEKFAWEAGDRRLSHCFPPQLRCWCCRAPWAEVKERGGDHWLPASPVVRA